MTETAPVLSLRDYRKPRPGCVGMIMPCVEAKVVKEDIVSKAKTEAQDQLTKARSQIEMERSKMQNDMHREMVEIAMTAAEKLISEKSNEEADRKAVDAFVKEASAYGQSGR